MAVQETVERARALSRHYRFVFPDRSLRGRQGELLGKNVGGAIEFHDHRPYFPGDDIRHVDWMVYGRTGDLVLKSYREEITPTTEIIADFSKSMGLDPLKEDLCRGLCMFLVEILNADSVLPVLWQCGTEPRKIRFDYHRAICEDPFEGRATLRDMVQRRGIRSKPNSMRVVISDFMFPHRPDMLLRRLSSNAAGMCVIQLAAEDEMNPGLRGGVLMKDCETGEELSMRINENTITRYRQKVEGISKGLEQTCRQAGAGFIRGETSQGLDGIIQQLVREGQIEPI